MAGDGAPREPVPARARAAAGASRPRRPRARGPRSRGETSGVAGERPASGRGIGTRRPRPPGAPVVWAACARRSASSIRLTRPSLRARGSPAGSSARVMLVRPVDESVEQRLVAHGVDQARHAARVAVNRPDRPGRERRPAVASRHAQAVVDVALGLHAGEGRQMVAHRDALSELPQPRVVQLLAQLRLADEDDLEQLALLGLEVGEQAHLLEQLVAQVLRLVDQEHDVVPGRRFLEQELIERLERRDAVALSSARRPSSVRITRRAARSSGKDSGSGPSGSPRGAASGSPGRPSSCRRPPRPSAG